MTRTQREQGPNQEKPHAVPVRRRRRLAVASAIAGILLGLVTTAPQHVRAYGNSGPSTIAAGTATGVAVKTDGSVWEWGGAYATPDYSVHFTASPTQVSGVPATVAVAAGQQHQLALTSSGTVFAWGDNTSGQLGQGTVTTTPTSPNCYCSTSPVQVQGLSGVVAVAAGGWFSLALESNGTVWAWGYNYDGELGLGFASTDSVTCDCIASPTVIPGLTGVTAISAAEYHSLAVTSTGAVYAWGWNATGQLGNGTTTTSATPTRVPGLPRIASISAGGGNQQYAFSEAVGIDGSVWAWGGNYYGQLGLGYTTTTTDCNCLTAPVYVPGVPTIVMLSTGEDHTLALGANGGVWAWGLNASGELGTGSTSQTGCSCIATPTSISGLSNVTSLAAGGDYSFASKSDGSLWSWGGNTYGDLANGTTGNLNPTPTASQMTGVASPRVPGPTWQVASTPQIPGYDTSVSCADSLHCWVGGDNGLGSTGIIATSDGGSTWTTESLPTTTPPNEDIWGIACPTIQVCWLDGMWDNGNATYSLAVERTTDGGATWAPVTIPAAIEQQTTVNPYAFGVSCPDATHCRFESFGWVVITNDNGATWSFVAPPAGIGFGDTLSCPDDTHCYVADGGSTSYPGKDAVLASSDGGQTWAVLTGLSTNGIYGLDCVSVLVCTAVGVSGSTNTSPGYAAATHNGWATYEAEQPPVDYLRSVACTDRAHCWASGSDANRNLTMAATDDGGTSWTAQVTPQNTGQPYLNSTACVAVAATAVTCMAVAGGNNSSHATVITSHQTVAPSARVATVCPPQCTTPIAAGGLHSVAVQADGSVLAWGDNSFGQLGNGSFTSSAAPVAVTGLQGVSSVAAGRTHSLALTTPGAVMAWGYNADGELGNGTVADSDVPVAVAGLKGVIAVAAGHLHSLALLADGTVAAWGDNTYGQLGVSPTAATNSVVPIQVAGLRNVIAIAAGAYHSLALVADGTVMSWGLGTDGQLGNGTTPLISTPAPVPNLTGAVGISAGWNHSVAVLVDGTVRAWGDNTYGQLGDGTTTQRTTPVEVHGVGGTGFLTGVSAVGAGWNTSLARKGDGSAWSWGDNTYGQLSANSNTSSSTPIQMLYESSSQQISNLAFVIALPGGGLHTDALKSDGTVAEAGLHPNTTHECLAAMSESGEQGVPAPAPETEQPPIADPVPTPQPEERGCPPTPQSIDNFGHAEFQLPGAQLSVCFADAWPTWMVKALAREDVAWHTTSSHDPRLIINGDGTTPNCTGGEAGTLQYSASPPSGCSAFAMCTLPKTDRATGQITSFVLWVSSSTCWRDDLDNVNMTCVPSTQYFDVLSALGHELGHVRGLDHVPPPGQPGCSIMIERLVPAAQSNLAGPYEFPRTPLPGDVKTMQRIYGV